LIDESSMERCVFCTEAGVLGFEIPQTGQWRVCRVRRWETDDSLESSDGLLEVVDVSLSLCAVARLCLGVARTLCALFDTVSGGDHDVLHWCR
jgi:hypothetical protein